MILDRKKTREDLFGLVGFFNANNPNYPALLPSLTGSRSGLYFNDAHPYITVENIDQSVKNFSHYNYPSFEAIARDNGDYVLGSKVVFSLVNYEYVSSVTSNTLTPDPGTDPIVWRVIDELSDYLIKSIYSGMDRMIDTYMNSKKFRARSKSIFENILLYNGSGDQSDIEENRGLFVGIRLRFKKKEKHLVSIINKIGHQFNGALTGLRVKVYHDSLMDPITSYEIDHNNARSFQWTNLSNDNTLRYFDNYDGGGDFYIGYKQSDLEALGAQAINKNVYWNSCPVNGDDVWRGYYKQYSQYIDVMGFSVSESEMIGDQMFDTEKSQLTPSRTYGLNLNFTVDNDLGPFILQEESIVAQAIKYNTAMVLMESIAYSTRGSNQIPNQIKSSAEKQLFQHKEARGSLADKCKDANDSLSFDFSNMDNASMPADNKFRLNIRRGSM